MHVVFDKLQESYLGYAAIFACIGAGFLVLRKINKKEFGPGYWALGFLFNGLGFIFWSGVVPLFPRAYYLLGEVCHVAGFMFLVAGAYRSSGNRYKIWNLVFLCAVLTVWSISLAMFRSHTTIAGIIIRALRAFVFMLAGSLLVYSGRKEKTIGRNIAGASLMIWASYIVVFSFIRINLDLYYGFLVGFQVLAAFGMVAMVMDAIRIRAEKSEKQVETLEGILPICAYCKKIRDEHDNWQVLEAYIEDRSEAEFSHGICPECFDKHRPDK
jgi:peptidoglycan/LPS O-acetylase OafA/YrhL